MSHILRPRRGGFAAGPSALCRGRVTAPRPAGRSRRPPGPPARPSTRFDQRRRGRPAP